MTMTPEQAYKELKGLYRNARHCMPPSRDALLSFGHNSEHSATYVIRHHRWTYGRAEAMVNRCRELVPLAMQYEP